jgi:hypothetical protein
MKSRVWYLCATLMVIASPCAFATVVPNGGGNQDSFGGGSGSGGWLQSSASAAANPSNTYSMGYGDGWYSETSIEGGEFDCECYVRVYGYAYAFWHTGESPFGGGFASASAGPLSLSASAPCSPPYPDQGFYARDDGGEPGGQWDFVPVSLDPFGSVSSSHSSGAVAIVGQYSQASASGSGSAEAWVYLY